MVTLTFSGTWYGWLRITAGFPVPATLSHSTFNAVMEAAGAAAVARSATTMAYSPPRPAWPPSRSWWASRSSSCASPTGSGRQHVGADPMTTLNSAPARLVAEGAVTRTTLRAPRPKPEDLDLLLEEISPGMAVFTTLDRPTATDGSPAPLRPPVSRRSSSSRWPPPSSRRFLGTSASPSPSSR